MARVLASRDPFRDFMRLIGRVALDQEMKNQREQVIYPVRSLKTNIRVPANMPMPPGFSKGPM